jgi:hypothetical protein
LLLPADYVELEEMWDGNAQHVLRAKDQSWRTGIQWGIWRMDLTPGNEQRWTAEAVKKVD